jgi:tetratricopeptide (TPR) repeat protein
LPHAFLAGFVFPVLANYEGAVEESQRAIELDRDKVVGYLLLGNDSIALNRLTDAKDAVRRASERKAESPLLSVLRYDIAFLEGDHGGMQKETNAAQGHSDAADWMQDREAFASASGGQLAKARDQSQRAVELAQQAGNTERAALFQAREALREGFFGNAAEARRGCLRIGLGKRAQTEGNSGC